MYDIKEATFWIKWTGLKQLHESLTDITTEMFRQSGVFKDDVKKRNATIDWIVKHVVKQPTGTCGYYHGQIVNYNLGDLEQTPQVINLISSLHSLFPIAQLYYDIFKQFEEGKFDEDLNFSHFILFDGPEAYREYAEAIEEVDEESAIKKQRCLEIVEQLEEFEDTYNEKIQYPYEQQPADDYFESVL